MKESYDALAERRIAVTRAPEQSESLVTEIEARGGRVIRCPTIRLAEPESWVEMDRALAQLDAYDWVVFTSPNGVRFTLSRMDALGLGIHGGLPSVAAAGPATAATLVERGVSVAFVASGEGSLPLAEALSPAQGASVLMARSDRSDPIAAEILRRRGARNVDEIVAYRTIPTNPGAEVLEQLREGVDGIAFTSPSTLRGFLDGGTEWRSLAEQAIVATLGPTTTKAAQAAGLVAHEAEEKTMKGLVDVLADGLRQRQAVPPGEHPRDNAR